MSEHKCNDKTPLVDAALSHQGDTHTDVTIRLMNLTRVARDLERNLRRLTHAGIKNEHEIEQILGKALGYPWFKDDQKNFPGATEEHGVCVGEHVAVTLAMEAAAKITELTKERDEALARPSQHEGAHATCWAEVERLQAALAQATKERDEAQAAFKDACEKATDNLMVGTGHYERANRAEAALAQAQTDALRYQKLKELAGTDEGWGVLETVFGDTSVEGWDAAIDSIEMQDTGTKEQK